MVKRLDFPLGFVRSFPIHIPLLLQMTYLASAADETNQALVSDKQKNNGKDQKSKDILTPLPYLNRCPELRKRHKISILRAKIQNYLHMCKIFRTFVADLMK